MKKVVTFFGAMGLILLLSTGCAGLPSPEEMESELKGFQLPKEPEEGKALVYVVRPAGVGGLIRFNVFVDDTEAESEMGYTRGSQYIYFNVTPGRHMIYSKAENWAEVEIRAEAGDLIFIEQEPTFGIIMARNNLYRVMNPKEGKYRVKTLSLGTIYQLDHPKAHYDTLAQEAYTQRMKEIERKEAELAARKEALGITQGN